MARVSRRKQIAAAQGVPVDELPKAAALRIFRTALYVRLSIMDTRDRKDSESLQTQIDYLCEYIAKHPDLELYDCYRDNGETGTNFDRPAYLEMMAEVAAGRVSTIIVKDHSRLGRNRLVVGILLEETFAQYHVRYIAINDGVDTINGIDDSIAVRDLFNEWHARDTSKKVKAVIMAAARRGERIGTSAPYGYKKDEGNSKHLIPDEQTAPVVTRIFELCMGGLGPDKIARILTQERVLTPTAYAYRTRGVRHSALNLDKPYAWSGSTVAGILEHEEYIGNTINCRTYTPSFKSKKSRLNPPDKILRFEGTHEPLIDLDTWEIVQRVRQGKRRPTKLGQQDMLSGLVYCKDCGSRHYFCRCGSWDESQYTFVCGKYHCHKEDCTPHTIKAAALRQIALSEIQRVSAEAREHWDELFQRLTSSHQSRAKKELAAKQRELDKGERRLKDLETLFRRSFEELALGHLSDGQFQTLVKGYGQEKAELEAKAETLRNEIANQQDTLLNADRFRRLVDKYTDITELTPELVREFIQRIEIHERSGRYKKKHYTQQVDIYFNFIGQA